MKFQAPEILSDSNKILPVDTIPPQKNNNRILKTIFLGILSSIFIIGAFWLINIAIYEHKELIFWVWPGVMAILGSIFLTLFSLVNYNRWLTWIFNLIPLIAYVLWFPKNIYAMAGGLIFLVMMIWFEQRIRSEEKSRQDFSINRTTAGSISVIIYAFFLMLGLNIYANTSNQFKEDPDRFYDKLGQSVVKSARIISGKDRSGIDFNQSLDEYLQTEAEQETPGYANLPEDRQKEITRRARQQFFDQFSIDVAGEKPLAEIMADIAVDQIKQSSQRFKPFFPLIFTIIVLALMRAFMFVFRWTAVLATWLVFRLLLVLKFFKIAKVQVEVGKLEI